MPLDPEAQSILDLISGATDAVDPFDIEPSRFREMFASMPGASSGPDLARVENLEIEGPGGPIPIRVYSPESRERGARAAKPALVFFHGGGFVLCGLDSHDATCRELADGADCVVVSVDYRLAPEAKFPAAPEDCYAATAWVASEADRLGIDVDRIAVAGDSAGGNLAAAVTLLCRDRGGPPLIHQLLIYPVTNHDFETESYQTNGEGYFLSRDMMRWFWHHYLESESDGEDPIASPLRAQDLSGLPPATVLTAEYDPLRDEGHAYAERLEKAGNPVAYTCYPGVFHGFFAMTNEIPRARRAVEEACAALQRAFEPEA